MIYKKSTLPEYPCSIDLWDKLAFEKRPIVVYGMGNGADKLISRFGKYGITIADFFASDGFVRGHSFHGKRVKSFSEIKAEYDDFVVVLSFASNRDEVIALFEDIDREYDLYIPDMPVAGEEYFDKDFYNQNYDAIISAYNSLKDDESRAIFSSVVNYKLSGKMKYLLECFSTRDEIYSLMPVEKIVEAVDAGAYNGDTIREIKGYFPNLKRVCAIEPDKKNYKKLVKYSEAETEIEVTTYNVGAWCNDGDGVFFGSGNRNSTLVATASFEHSREDTSLVAIDSLTGGKTDYIKYDVEGAEREALRGSCVTITDSHPTLLISLYHRSRDIFELVNTIAESYPEYDLYLRRLRCLPAWEIDLIAVKK